MTELSREILADWQVRKTKQQKTAFIELLRSRLPGAVVEEGGLAGSRNIVLGDLARAKVVFTAHYDTCAALPFPNFLTPRNIPFYVLFNLFVALVLLAAVWLVSFAVALVSDSFWLSWLAGMAVVAAFLLLVFCGRPNPHTANDNTSGVVTLLEVWSALDERQRAETAFVFFDNEEAGLFGSAQFAKRHRRAMRDKLLVNFDCVSDGDELLLILKRRAEAAYGEALRSAFRSEGEKTVRAVKASTTLYPSDQANFPVTAALAAFRRSPLLGLYLSRIHTPRDTVFDEENIRLLRDGALRLVRTL